MTRLVLTINERTKRGKLIMQLLNEFRSGKDLSVTDLEAFEAAEEKIIASHSRSALKSTSINLDQARRALLKLKKRVVI